MRAENHPPAPRVLAARLRHRPGCGDPDPRAFVGVRGDVVVKCARCAFYVVARDVVPASLGWPELAYRALDERPPRPEDRADTDGPKLTGEDLPPAVQALLRHRSNCGGAEVRALLGREGDPLLVCGGCSGFRFVDPGPSRTWLLGALRSASRPAGDVAPASPSRATMTCGRCELKFEVRPGRAVVPLCPDCRDQASRRHGRSREADRGWA